MVILIVGFVAVLLAVVGFQVSCLFAYQQTDKRGTAPVRTARQANNAAVV